jgi:copper oxidase (laccase) domain-containing protein
MNVYKISKYWIAAKNVNDALYQYLNETDCGEISFYEIKEGESDEYTINLYRLTEKEIDRAEVTCCFNGCELCDGNDEPVLFSYREMINKQDKFPCVICREE